MKTAQSKAPAGWLRTAGQLVRRLPVKAPRAAARRATARRIPLPSDLSIIARDRRLMPVQGRVTVNPDKYVLLAALAGRGTIELDDGRFRLAPGDVMLIVPHQAHQFAALETAALRWVFIGFRIERADTLLQPLKGRPVAAPPAVRAGLAPFLSASLAGDPADVADRPDLAARLWLMLTELLRQTPPVQAAARGPAGPAARPWRLIEYVHAYIGEHERVPLTARELARQMHVSPTSLRRRFRACMGLSLARYLRARRLRQAIDYKLRAEATWSETADRFGFGSIYSFSRAFKKEFKLSPSAYQRALRPR